MSKFVEQKGRPISQYDPVAADDDGEEDFIDLGPVEMTQSADIENPHQGGKNRPRGDLPPKSKRADILPHATEVRQNNTSGRWRNWCIIFCITSVVLWLAFKYWIEHDLDEEKGHSKIPLPLSPTVQPKSNSTISQSSNKSSDVTKQPSQPAANQSNKSVINTTAPGNNNQAQNTAANQTSSNTSNQTQPSTPNQTISNGSTSTPNATSANQTETPKTDTNTTAPNTTTNPPAADPSDPTHTPTTGPKPEQLTEEPSVEPAVSYYWVVHTHLDLGWLQPEQELFDIKARSIFDTTLEYLQRNPDARMTLSDFAFVYMYIHEPDVPADLLSKRKQNLQAAFDSGQLEAVNGGFVMPDFAVTTHDELLSNWHIGKHWGKKHFNVSVSSMWSIDQFGYSKVVTRLAKECGFHENFINRIIHEYQGLLRKNSDIIFRWRYGDNPGDDLVSLQLEEHYEILKFRADVAFWGVSEFMMTNQEYILGTNFNFVNTCVEYFDYVHRWTNYSKSKVKLIPFGGDFHFSNYPNTIHFIEMLTLCVKSNNHTGQFAGKFNVRTTTLAEFLKALKSDFVVRNVSINTFTFDESAVNSTFPSLSTVLPEKSPSGNYGDLFPYTEYLASNLNRKTWSGYYSTAPHAKKVMRSHGELHRGMRCVFAAALARETGGRVGEGRGVLGEKAREVLDGLEETDWAALGNLHHDAITGVSNNFVNSHYVKRCQANNKESRLEWKSFINTLVTPEIDEAELSNLTRIVNYDRDSLRHRRYEHSRFNDAFYDRQEHILKRDGYDIRFAMPSDEYWFHQKDSPDYLILNQGTAGRKIFRVHSPAANVQIALNLKIATESNSNNTTQNSSNTPVTILNHSTFKLKSDLYEHVFATDFSQFEAKLLKIEPNLISPTNLTYSNLQSNTTLPNSTISISISNNSHLILQIPDTNLSLSIGFFEYKYNDSTIEVVGDRKGDPYGDERFGPVLMKVKPPGKYIFTTTVKDARPLNISSAKYSYRQTQSELHVVVFYNKEQCSLNVYYIPSAPNGQRLSTRLVCLKKYRAAYDRVVRYEVMGHRDDDGTFFTDSNSLDRIRRRRFARGQFIETNYYPITRFISLEDKKHRLSIVVDRPEGGASPAAGVLELMVDRESITSDDLGIFDFNVEMEPINVLHYVVWEEISQKDESLYRTVQIAEDTPPIVVQLLPMYNHTSFALNASAVRLPSQVGKVNPHIKIHVDTTDGSDFFVRIHNLHDHEPATVDVIALTAELFGSKAKAVTEYSLDFAKSVVDMEAEAPQRAWPGEVTPWRHPSDDPHKSVYHFIPLKVRAFKVYL